MTSTERLPSLPIARAREALAADRAFRVFTSAGDLSFDEEIDRGAVLQDALRALHLSDGNPRSFKDVLHAICEADGRTDLDIILALRSAVMALLELTWPVDDEPAAA